MKFLCDQCKAKYQIADEKVAGKTVRMKCRKCGHLIEVRAAVTESSTTSSAPPPGPSPSGNPPSVAPKPPKPAPPRATSLAASFTSARPSAPKPERPPGALAGAFKTTVQREEEVSAPFDMSELSPGDDWYVAVHGVPVGPVRVAEVRRKAALGAVTEDSLVWQEGLDEWRPLRTFPELAAIVREAVLTSRPSMTPPPPDARQSLVPPASRSVSSRPAASSIAPRAVLPRPAPLGVTPPARSNVVPFTSRLATAERIEQAPPPRAFTPTPAPMASPTTETRTVASVAPLGAASGDPFGPAPVALGMVGMVSSAAPAVAGSELAAAGIPGRRSPPWIAIAMVAAAIAFGVTAAIALFFRPPPAQPVVVQVPAPAPPPPVASATPAATPSESPEAPPPPTPTTKTPGGTGGAIARGPTSPGNEKKLDLHGIGQGGPLPGVEPGGGDSPAAGQCLSQGQIVQAIGQHQVAVRRACWDRNPSAKNAVSINVSLTVGGDGTAQGVSASGDDPAVARCIENDVRNWHFPAMGCSQKVAIPFKFVRQ